MRYLGLDLGSRTLGVSVSDKTGLIASNYKTIRHNEEYDKLLDEVVKLVNELEVEAIVLGFPKNMNNTEGPRVEASQHYGKLLQQSFPDIPIDFQDERLTTVEAHRMLVEEADISRAKQKKVIDEVAATFILQSYLDRHGRLVNKLK